MKVLVTGGLGYIGSFMTKKLLDEGHEVTVADSLERGHEFAKDNRAKILIGDLKDKGFVKKLFKYRYDGIIHFAAYISVAESVQNPFIYFQNNIQASLTVVDEMMSSGQNNFIFSSTAGVYGSPEKTPISEDYPKNPENPYGESKLIVEKILNWYAKTKKLSYAALRYFNAAGGALDATLGEAHDPETHIIPNIISAIVDDTSFTLFGDDYETKDGTCVRDYIHVLDLAQAHVLALKKLLISPMAYTYNVGTGNGYSNREVLEVVKKVTGKNVKVAIGKRRQGDANILVADPTKIKKELGFSPVYSDLETIVKTAWNWHRKKIED